MASAIETGRETLSQRETRLGPPMDVVFVTANFPYPPDSGATIRTCNLLDRMARRHRVHLIAYADPSRDAHRIAHFESSCASVTPVLWHDSKGTPGFYLELLRNVASPIPFSVARFTTEAMTNAISRVVATVRPGVLCCDFVALARNLPAPGVIPRHLTAHNVESVIWERYLEHEKNLAKRAYIAIEYRKMARFESATLRSFDHVACMSEPDRANLRDLSPASEYSIVPNGVDLDYFRVDPTGVVPYRMVFTGSMDWRPNQDAVRFFLETMYPRIKAEEPRATALFVGRRPPAGLEALAERHPGVTMLGSVEDMRPHLATAAAYVVPLRIGGGTRLKILEAMAVGRPVISTGVGAEGLDVTPGRDLLVADEPEAFTAAVRRVFDDRALAQSLSENGRKTVEQTYGWDRIADKLDETWRATARRSTSANRKEHRQGC